MRKLRNDVRDVLCPLAVMLDRIRDIDQWRECQRGATGAEFEVDMVRGEIGREQVDLGAVHHGERVEGEGVVAGGGTGDVGRECMAGVRGRARVEGSAGLIGAVVVGAPVQPVVHERGQRGRARGCGEGEHEQ